MSRRDRGLPSSTFTADGPYLIAILGVLDDLHDMLEERLPKPGEAEPMQEPARPERPDEAVPVREPAPVKPPKRPDTEPVPVTEPTPAPMPEAPPRAGRGSSAAAWRAFADAAGVEVDEDASRDDIVAACELAEVIEAK